MPSAPKLPLRIMHFNLENFFVYLENYTNQDLKKISEDEWQKLSISTTENKMLRKIWAIKHIFDDVKPDIATLNEVGGPESLENFNKYFLDDAYLPFIKEGNSDRGIDVGYLINKDLPVKPLLISHKNRSLDLQYPFEKTKKNYFFARDVAELRLFRIGENSPKLVLLLAHLKSKLDPDGIDSEGKIRREAELKSLVGIYNEVSLELNHEVPIIVAGDFNGNASPISTDPEFEYLYANTDLSEALDAAGVPSDLRATQIQFPKFGTARPMQLDYIFVSKNLKDKIVKDQTYIYMFKSDGNVTLPYPQSYDQRTAMPSDHHPVVLTIQNILLDT